MKSKFHKYWGEPEKMNTLIFIANVLDPRDKLVYMEFTLKQMYGEIVGCKLLSLVALDLTLLFDEYIALYGGAHSGFFSASTAMANNDASQSGNISDVQTFGKATYVYKARFKKQKIEAGLSGNKKIEL